MDHITDTAGFRIEADPSRDLLRISLSGFFDAATVARLSDARVKARAQLTCPPNQHVTLVDVTRLKLQAQALLPAFMAQICDPALKSRLIAFVVGGSLARMQVRRVTGRDGLFIAATVAEAEAYLFAPTAEARASAA